MVLIRMRGNEDMEGTQRNETVMKVIEKDGVRMEVEEVVVVVMRNQV